MAAMAEKDMGWEEGEVAEEVEEEVGEGGEKGVDEAEDRVEEWKEVEVAREWEAAAWERFSRSSSLEDGKSTSIVMVWR